ncbi:MAG: putative DNA binding domain-containing protein [Kiritimatiellae bacterium]|nr:putative DNA binding domain-containing protein [Kiritimatiellia bacterium]
MSDSRHQATSPDIDLEEEAVAFLNRREGGILYIGIDKAGKPVGVKDIDGDILKIKDRLRNNLLPSAMGLFDVTADEVGGVKVIKVFFAGGSEKPYYLKRYGMTPKGCFIRVGTACEPMPEAMIEDLFARRVRNSIGRIRSVRQDLTFEQLRIYYQEHGFKLNDNFARTLELLTDDGAYNYAAYLLADENANSIKVAKYAGCDRVELVANNEYGMTSLVTATKRVIERLKVENTVRTRKTALERIDTPLWDEKAVREAVINAIVHNDYTREVPPKVELFSDHLEITSFGRLPEGLTKDDFFAGVSIPRNKELMRIFRDLELVESLGSGMGYIMQKYARENFIFLDNFIRMTVPYITQDREGQPVAAVYVKAQVALPVTPPVPQVVSINPTSNPTSSQQVTLQVNRLLSVIKGDMPRSAIMSALSLKDRVTFTEDYLRPAVRLGLIELTQPDSPRSPTQKYRLTAKGLAVLTSASTTDKQDER